MKIIPNPGKIEVLEESRDDICLFENIEYILSNDFEGERYSIDIEKERERFIIPKVDI